MLFRPPEIWDSDSDQMMLFRPPEITERDRLSLRQVVTRLLPWGSTTRLDGLRWTLFLYVLKWQSELVRCLCVPNYFFQSWGLLKTLFLLSLIFILHFFRTTEWTILVILFMDLDMLDFTRTSDKHQCIICCMNFMKSKFGSELIFWHIIPTALWVKCWSPKKWQWQRKSWCW